MDIFIFYVFSPIFSPWEWQIPGFEDVKLFLILSNDHFGCRQSVWNLFLSFSHLALSFYSRCISPAGRSFSLSPLPTVSHSISEHQQLDTYLLRVRILPTIFWPTNIKLLVTQHNCLCPSHQKHIFGIWWMKLVWRIYLMVQISYSYPTMELLGMHFLSLFHHCSSLCKYLFPYLSEGNILNGFSTLTKYCRNVNTFNYSWC